MKKPFLEVKENDLFAYANDVRENRVTACLFIKQAVARFWDMYENDAYEFRRERADRVVNFFGLLRHFQGKHAGRRFRLESWQIFIVAYVYGFYYRGTEKRVTSYVYIQMARKQGKTAFAAGLCLYHLLFDSEADPEVDLAANSKEQSKICYKFVSEFARALDGKRKILDPYRDKVKLLPKPGVLQVFASDTTKLDGFNASMYLIDEYHAAPNSKMKDVLQSSQGMRENPLGVIITTAGFDKLGVCAQYRDTCTEILAGIKQDENTAAFIFEPDINDAWDNEETWIKSNPNLGVTTTLAYLRKQVTAAKNDPAEEVGVRTKNFNQWVDSSTTWIPDVYIQQATAPVSLEDYRGYTATAGIDLSATSDLGALGVCIPIDADGVRKYVFYVKYYLPESALIERQNKELYKEWKRRGLLTITPGNVTDYDVILKDLMDICHTLNIVNVAYDSWNATQFVINASQAGVPMQAFSQLLGNFNRPTKEFERLARSGRVVLDDNEINRHCFRNVAIATDRNGNEKPAKGGGGAGSKEKKIDGVISILEALGIYMQMPHYGEFY